MMIQIHIWLLLQTKVLPLFRILPTKFLKNMITGWVMPLLPEVLLVMIIEKKGSQPVAAGSVLSCILRKWGIAFRQSPLR